MHVFFIDTGTVYTNYLHLRLLRCYQIDEDTDFFFLCVYQADNLSEALKKLKITSTDSTADSLEGCLDCLLQALAQNSKLCGPFTFKSFEISELKCCRKTDSSSRLLD